MTQFEQVTMTMRELDRLKTIQAVAEGVLKPWRAAERLELTTRQLRRLVLRYQAEGPLGIASRHRKHPGNRQMPAERQNCILALLREQYADFGPTLAAEKLAEDHGLAVSKETVRLLMIAIGLWIPRRQRLAKIQQPRQRRSCAGELIQIDGCEHRWFEDRGPPCTALVYVDDATSRLMQVHFTGAESTFGYFEATRGYLQAHGKPLAFYSDKASVFPCQQERRNGRRGLHAIWKSIV
jgi:hypothetical protein